MTDGVPQALAVMRGGLRVHGAEAPADQRSFGQKGEVERMTLRIAGICDERSVMRSTSPF